MTDSALIAALDTAGVPEEIRERLQEWIALAAAAGVEAVAARLEEQNGRLREAFGREAAAVERLLGA